MDALASAFGVAKDMMVQIPYSELPAHILTAIKAHPYQTAFQVGNIGIMIVPGAITGPVLVWLGCGAQGPVAGNF
jgi:hypothetical protein